MATTLNLFPSRIRFTNDDGTLTPEAYRALQTLVSRSGGVLGDNGVDTFGDLTGAGSQDSSITDMVSQQASVNPFIPDVVQAASLDAVTASVSWSAPVTKTGDFTVAAGETWIINNKAGSTCTATLPSAASFSGRPITFQNYQAQLLVSASSNVVPKAGGAAGTAILDAVAGNWATLVSDGGNWVILQSAPNNILLME